MVSSLVWVLIVSKLITQFGVKTTCFFGDFKTRSKEFFNKKEAVSKV